MMDFNTAFEKLLGHEGGYSDHPQDRGGPTRWGVTEKVARANGYTGDMRALPQDKAKAIARSEYWNAVRAEQMPIALKYPLFDAAYHSGPGQATKWLQRALGVPDDGKIGPVTLGTANFQDPQKTLSRFMGHRLEFMATRKNWDSFSEGWAMRVASLLKEA